MVRRHADSIHLYARVSRLRLRGGRAAPGNHVAVVRRLLLDVGGYIEERFKQWIKPEVIAESRRRLKEAGCPIPQTEARVRYEYFHNPLWGAVPQDEDGYWLQRYMLHADAHFTEWFRAFAQFKSGLETDRKGGPRPTDRDEADLHQAFFDVRVPLPETNALTLRVGWEEYTLRAGDRDYLPANTEHSAVVHGNEPVIYLIGIKY